MILYGYWRSSSSWRVRIALNLKGITYENVPVHLVKDGGRQHAPEHVARNPMHQVPVLEVERDGQTHHLTQSLAILYWLEQEFPEPRLIPRDPLLAHRAWEAAELINSGIQPLQNLATALRVQAFGGDRHAWSATANSEGLGALETLVRDAKTPFMVGDSPTIADICLIPQLYSARRYDLDLSIYPTLLRIEAACEALPAFQHAHPSAQPDAQ